MARGTIALALLVAGLALASAAPSRKMLGEKALPYAPGSDMGPLLNMMDTQNAVQRVSDFADGYPTAALAVAAQQHAAGAAYGGPWSSFGPSFGRKLQQLRRSLLGEKALPFNPNSDMGTHLNMMDTQAAVQRVSGSADGFPVAAVAVAAQQHAAGAAYGGPWSSFGPTFGRKLQQLRRSLLGEKALPYAPNSEMGPLLNMMDTQNAVQRVSGSADGFPTAAVAVAAQQHTAASAYGGPWSSFGPTFGRKLSGSDAKAAATAKAGAAAKDAAAAAGSDNRAAAVLSRAALASQLPSRAAMLNSMSTDEVLPSAIASTAERARAAGYTTSYGYGYGVVGGH